ncbi:flagellar motor switch protein FliN [Salidesulfovibrio onnuriiensis]|uniref:flagellar motor switch protein FliN n=1 Tax=Salidesulfovibrio onnuriiensis TaxID=2583823 RepID=UPI0011C94E1C|nr:flagellar motor switch protein FliN [Salidesulfovibrio onnuriiensis]
MADEQDKLAEEWAAALGGDEDGGDVADDDMAAMAADADTGASADEALADEWAAALADTEADDVRDEKEQAFLATQAHPAQFEDMTAEAKAATSDGMKRDLEFILDIPLDVSAELGRTKLLINELLQLGQGSVVELNKLAGEPLEIYVNGKLVARGEAVVINEKFGIRLTDIISPIERVKQLG